MPAPACGEIAHVLPSCPRRNDLIGQPENETGHSKLSRQPAAGCLAAGGEDPVVPTVAAVWDTVYSTVVGPSYHDPGFLNLGAGSEARVGKLLDARRQQSITDRLSDRAHVGYIPVGPRGSLGEYDPDLQGIVSQVIHVRSNANLDHFRLRRQR